MDLENLFALCQSQGVELSVNDGELNVNFDNTPSDELIALLRAHKPALIDFISQFQQSQAHHQANRQITRLARNNEGPYSAVLSYAQQRLWLIDQIEGGSAQYNMPSALEFSGHFDEAAARRAFATIIERHDSLRTVFEQQQQQVLQRIVAPQQIDFQIHSIDLSHLSNNNSEQTTAIAAVIDKEYGHIFDLTQDLMLRVTVIRRAADQGVLLLNLHHIASDGWSIDILVKEFCQLYHAYINQQPSPLAPLLIQYADFAHWQTQQDATEALNYWRQQLAGIPQTHNLGLDKPRFAQQTFSGAVISQTLGQNDSHKLETLARQQDVTLFMLLQTAFAVLLGRYSNETDIVMGTPVAGRTHPDVEPLIGFFVNTLVLRTDLDDAPSFSALLKRNKHTIAEAFSHQQLPFEQLVEQLNPQRSLAHNSLFQIMFVLQNNEQTELTLPGLTLTELPAAQTIVRFDLELKIYQDHQGLQLKWLYNKDLFNQSSIERLSYNFNVLLGAIAQNPQQSIATLPLLGQAEIQLILDWNQTQVAYPTDLTIHQLFVAQAAKTPAAVAVVDHAGQLSYQQLFEQAYDLSITLKSRQLQPQELVAVRLPKGRDQVIATLAIMMAGGAYLPLETYWPDERCNGVIQAGGCRIMIADGPSAQLPNIEQLSTNALPASRLQAPSATQWLANPQNKVPVNHLAYVIFTSGSTGKPKGVAIEHQSAVNTLVDINNQYGITDNDSILAISALSFDLSVYDFFGLLAVGGKIVFPDDLKASEPQHWLQMIEQHQITLWDTTPASAMLLAEQLELNQRSSSAPIQHFLLSGDWIPPTLPKRLWQGFKQCQVHSLGGATEGSIWSIHYPIHQDPSQLKSIPYGRPLSNQRFYILNSHGDLCPLGVIGELHIGGVGVAREYYADPQRSEASFIWHQQLGQRLYKTGDLGRYLVDDNGQPDNIEFIGRVDNQVKLRGYRIELGEIESTITQLNAIQTCLVLVQGDSAETQQLVAYVCPESQYLSQRAASTSDEMVEQWTDIFDDAYSDNEIGISTESGNASPEMNLSGWNSSYTDQAIAAAQMLEWIEGTVARIIPAATTATDKPQKVLEIGCGTGLLLYRYSHHFAEVHALDISATALSAIRRQCNRNGWQHVSLYQGDALSIATNQSIQANQFDTIVINSVVQYFPNRRYLLDVIKAAMALLAEGGKLFIGDIRNLDLLDAHNSAIARDKLDSNCTVGALAAKVQHSAQQEKELLISPSLFATLSNQIAQVGAVDIMVKRGLSNNEMLRYRYDVAITKTASASQANSEAVPITWLNWQGEAALKTLLAHQRYHTFGLYGVENARLANDVWLANGLKSWHSAEQLEPQQLQRKNAADDAGAALEKLLQFAQSYGYQCCATWSQSNDDQLDILFSQGPLPTIQAKAPYQQRVLTNYPQLSRLAAPLSTTLKDHLALTLPNYMQPNSYVYLERLPLTANGKIDRKALPNPGENRALNSTKNQASQLPNDPLESRLCQLFEQVLNLDKVSIHEDFFAAGGHSLLATRLISAIAKNLDIQLQLRQIFAHPSVYGLAKIIREDQTAQNAEQSNITLPDIVPSPVKARYPLSFAQQRLWFINQMEGPSSNYNISGAFELHGELDCDAFAEAFRQIVERHQILRSQYIEADGSQWQVIQPHFQLPFELIDLSTESGQQPNQQPQSIEQIIEQRCEAHFDLSCDVLLRLTVVKLAAQRFCVIFNMHHIASDGWSLEVLVKELSALYLNAQALPALALQYHDYAQWQHQWLSGDRLKAEQQYWHQRLAGIPSIHKLPLDYPRPPQQTFKGARHRSTIEPRITSELNQLAKSNGATLFMLLQSAFAVLLYRYSDETDIVMGTPIAGRNHQDLEPLIGFFVNTLVLRTQCDPNASFLSLLKHNRQEILDAYQHQHMPFELLVESLQPERNLSYNPLFQVMFIMQNIEQQDLTLSGLTLHPLERQGTTAKFELELNAIETPTGLQLHWSYNTGLFNQDSIKAMADNFTVLLKAITVNGQTPINQLPILTEQARQQQLLGFNHNLVEFDTNLTISQLFEHAAEQYPEHIALVIGQQTLSYRQLNQQANQLAHYLIKQGVGPDTLVGLCMNRSMDVVVAMLAIVKAGGAYLPLDPKTPQQRLDFIMTESKATILLSQQALADTLDSDQLVCIENLTAQLADLPLENPRTSVTSNHLAYTIYTSGSTGKPKGVMIEHCALVNSILSDIDIFTMTPDSRFLHMVSFNFDAATSHLFMTLCAGGSVYLYDPQNDNLDLASYAERHDISHTAVTVSMLAAQPRLALPKLETLITGAEFCPPELADFWAKGRRFFNVYGPTETTITATTANYGIAEQRNTIGKPIRNFNCYVLDPRRQPVPIGVIGELYIGGVGIARGYINRPAQNQSVFLTDPFIDKRQTKATARMYKTGDLVRWTRHGCLEFIGRVDHQVKIRGYRIELGEIEAKLSQLEAVKTAVVIDCAVADSPSKTAQEQHKSTEKQLVAYLVLNPERAHPQVLTAIKEQLQQALPEYMVPNVFMVLDTIPLSLNGKVDRHSLPKPKAEDIYRAPFVAPSNERESQLCELWQTLLGQQQVGVRDNFFALGGHSLLATRMVSQLREMYNIELAIKTLFAAPTISALLAAIDQQRTTNSTTVVMPPLEKHASPANQVALSFAQQRLWFIDRLEGGSAQYNIPAALRLEGDLNTSALYRAFETIIERHQVLRTYFVSDAKNNSVYQQVSQTFELPLTTHDFSDLPPAQQTFELTTLTQQASRHVFDLSRDLKLTITVVRLSQSAHVILLNLHHIAADGWSMNLLVSELSQLYNAFAAHQPNPLPTLKFQYADYACWQRKWLTPDNLRQHIDYWQQQLAGIPQVHSLPLDRPRPAQQSYRGKTYRQAINPELTAKLNLACQQHEVTLFMLLQSTFAVLLSRYANQSDIVIGTPIAGRMHQDTESLIGFFTNTLVLRTDLAQNPTGRALLKQNRQTILAAYEHQHLGFETLVEQLKPQRSLSHNPLFQVMLVLQNNHQQPLQLDGLTLSAIPPSDQTTQFDLNLNINEYDGQLHCNWQFASDLFELTTIQAMAAHFSQLLGAMVDTPDTPVAQMPLFDEQVQTWRFGEIQHLQDSCQTSTCIQQMFTLQAAKTPDATAIVFGEQTLSYRSLDWQSDYYAQQLQARGVKANDVIALYTPRSFEMIIGMLAILKAGAAYLPIDTILPRAMIETRLALAEVKMMLNSSSEVFDCPQLALAANHSQHQQWIDFIPVHNQPDDSAYVLFTSGSTGEPKGIEMGHGPLVNLITAIKQDCPLAESAKIDILQFSSIGFDMSFTDCLLALSSGGKICLIDEQSKLDPAKLLQLVAEHQLNVLNLPYSVLQAICRYANEQAVNHQKTSYANSLKVIFSTAEQLKINDDIRHFFDRHDCTLINHYGPTETHVVTSKTLPSNPLLWPELPTIGRPILNTRCEVLDPHLNPLPKGIFGQLYIGGSALAKGYVNREQLTRERFITLDDGQRLYQTGDWVRWLANGELEYLGRMDDQVKIRGYRIELGEVEACLLSFAGVKQALVMVHEQQLLAYVVATTADTIDGTVDGTAEGTKADQLKHSCRQWCRSKLPDYMVPGDIQVLAELPLNANGKVDRKALPKSQQLDLAQYQAPTTAIEQQLVRLWADLLKLDPSQISAAANFFALGGHSLLITQLISAIRHQWSVEMAIKQVFEQQTLVDQANLIDELLTLNQGLNQAAPAEQDPAKQDQATDEWEF